MKKSGAAKMTLSRDEIIRMAKEAGISLWEHGESINILDTDDIHKLMEAAYQYSPNNNGCGSVFIALSNNEIIEIARTLGLMFYDFDKNKQLAKQIQMVTYAEFEAEINRIYQSGRNAGLQEAAEVCEGGSFLHDDAPDARFGKACATAIRARIKGGV